METQSSKYPADHSPPLEEKIISLFEPDMLLPALYLENFRRKTPVEPERRLMLAVLEDAINCFQANLMAQGKRGQKLQSRIRAAGIAAVEGKNTTAQPDAAFSKKDGRVQPSGKWPVMNSALTQALPKRTAA